MKYRNEPLGNGYYRETNVSVEYDKREEYITTTTGFRGEHYGRWQGMVKIKKEFKHIVSISGDSTVEVVNMVDGKRDGKSIVKHYINGKLHETEYPCYSMDKRIECKKSAYIRTEDISAFQVLSYKYPWFLNDLNFLGFNDEYMEVYMDTLESVLATYEFEVIDFDQYYEYAIADLEKTTYDSLISDTKYLVLRIFQGMDELRNNELRMAVIDHYRSDGKTTYDMVETTYPGYLLSINNAGVNNEDFLGFCDVLDSLMSEDEVLYGALDPEDSLFIDSVDTRLFRALAYISETKKSLSSAELSLNSTVQFINDKNFKSIYGKFNFICRQLFLKSSPSDVVEVVLDFMREQFDRSDLIKRAIRKAYFDKKGVISVPTVTTGFSSHNSATSVSLNGHVIEDGGGAVNSRGIAWETYYDPTTDDHKETSGTGIGEFSVTVTGLTEGSTYYARTYATNSAGTAYGNCIRFTATSTVGIVESSAYTPDFIVYPNPASAVMTFRFTVESLGDFELLIMNIKGQVAYSSDFGDLPFGDHKIMLDLSSLENGIYTCQLLNNGKLEANCKLVISR
jgi:hypothetical protein